MKLWGRTGPSGRDRSTSSPTRPAAAEPSWHRRGLFVAILVISLLAFAELASWVAYGLVARKAFSYERLRAEQEAQAAGRPTVDGDVPLQAQQLYLAEHPYLGYVYSPEVNDEGLETYHGHRVNRFGFLDSAQPVHRLGPDRVVVGIVGGSVAYWLSAQGDQALIAELKSSPRFRDRDVVLVRLALGGYKQPQQLMALTWLLSVGGQLDILVNLDGVNEVRAVEFSHFDQGIYPFYPNGWSDIVNPDASLDRLRLIGELTYLRHRRREWARCFTGTVWQDSISLQLLWKVRDRMLGQSIERAGEALLTLRTSLPYVDTGPGIDGFTRENLYSRLAEYWERCSILLDRLCRANGIRYYHFLQPNQYVGSKPMGDAERVTALLETDRMSVAVREGYREMRVHVSSLRNAGVVFEDLTPIFDEVPEPVYVDNCCHLNRHGYEIVGRHIARAIVRDHDARETSMAESRDRPEGSGSGLDTGG